MGNAFRYHKRRDHHLMRYPSTILHPPPIRINSRRVRNACTDDTRLPASDKYLRKQNLKLIDDVSSFDERSVTSNFSSCLSVDVSNEMAAVNRDIEALLDRYEKVLDNTAEDDHQKKFKVRQRYRKGTWFKDGREGLIVEEESIRKTKPKRKGTAGLTKEQLKMLAMEKLPTEKCREVNEHLLHQSTVPHLEGKKPSGMLTEPPTCTSEYLNNLGFDHKQILHSLLNDLVKNGFVDNVNSKLMKNANHECTLLNAAGTQTTKDDEKVPGTKSRPSSRDSNGSSSPNKTSGVNPECCRKTFDHYVTTYPTNETNWKILLNSSKCQLIPSCPHKEKVPKELVVGCRDSAISVMNKSGESNGDKGDLIDKSVNTEPIDWRQLFEFEPCLSMNFRPEKSNSENATCSCNSETKSLSGNCKTQNLLLSLKSNLTDTSGLKNETIQGKSDIEVSGMEKQWGSGKTGGFESRNIDGDLLIERRSSGYDLPLNLTERLSETCGADEIGSSSALTLDITKGKNTGKGITNEYPLRNSSTQTLLERDSKSSIDEGNIEIGSDSARNPQNVFLKTSKNLSDTSIAETSEKFEKPLVQQMRPKSLMTTSDKVDETFSAGGDRNETLAEMKNSLINFIDQSLRKEFLSTDKSEDGSKFEENFVSQDKMDTGLCVEIIRRLTDSMMKCETAGQRSHNARESVYLHQLKQLRTDHLRHIQREVKHIEDLDK